MAAPASEVYQVSTALIRRGWRATIAKLLRVGAFVADGDDASPWPGAEVGVTVRERATGRTVFEVRELAEDAARLTTRIEGDLSDLDADRFRERWAAQ